MKYKVLAFPNPKIFQYVGETDELFGFLFITGMLDKDSKTLKVYLSKEEIILDGIKIKIGTKVVFIGKQLMMVRIVDQDASVLFYHGKVVKDQGDLWLLQDNLFVKKSSLTYYSNLKVASVRLLDDEIICGYCFKGGTGLDLYETGNVFSGVLGKQKDFNGVSLETDTFIILNEEGYVIYAEKKGKVILGSKMDLPKRRRILASEEANIRINDRVSELARKYNF